MAEEMDEFKALFREEAPILPRKEARRVAIADAEARFEKNSKAAQGTGFLRRLTGWVKGNNNRKRSMHQIKLSHMLMAGTSLAVLSFAIVNTNWSLLQHQFDVQTPVQEPAAPPKLTKQDAVTQPTLGNEAETKVSEGASGAANVKPSTDRLVFAEEPQASPPLAEEDQLVDMLKALPAAEQLANESAVATAPASPKILAKRQAAGKMKAASSDALSLNAGSATAVAGAVQAENLIADQQAYGYRDQGRDKFTDIVPNPVKVTAEEPISTFSIDVDSSSYSFVRSSLMNNVLPQKDAVRVEEMINYFPYDYAGPTDKSEPFKASVTVMATPWNANTKLMHIGIKGFSLNGQEKPRSNLVFLLDTSGSMDEPNKLPLLQNSLRLLVETLGPEDTVSIVTYAGSAGAVLQPTKVKDKGKIFAALDNLMAGGSTAGAEGIRQAYQLAEQSFDPAGVNRVILATDGDFNVGITDPQELKSFVERKRATGVYLSVLGFGRGNYNDELMQTLAQNGNGNAAYIDTLNEARKVLVEEASSTLFPIAKDVKIQVEFNPQTVSEYRLIGYETRMLNREDFNNDKVDAGEIGAGHTVTAIYEFTPKGSVGALVDPLRYGQANAPQTSPVSQGNEYAFLKIRYKLPNEEKSKLISEAISSANETAPSSESRFSVAVAAFGQLLRGGQYTNLYNYDDILSLADGAKGKDEFGYRAEFASLVRLAKTAQGLDTLKP